ncbi:Flagellar biosynthesis protein FlhA [Burkholderiales bacterium]|nr:MAG: flagellar biosynthesis protein FlhA [Burkholderiales bacterium]CAG0994378.1 Flagellar biosynthesis protein FlhA [Burkholderiales bacterium]
MNGSLKLPFIPEGVPIRSLAAPLVILAILSMMVLPLPPMLLDVLFTFNIALSIMVLLVGLSTLKPLDFAAFPTILLLTTLLRLSLNIASTRVVLLEGHTGPDAAGKVIEAFGHFLVGGNYTVGIVVFVILVIINFVVITKGAGRIAEVSARFTLDAMPGKQMAIDADLNAGLIGEEEARKRRTTISQEADFFGSMDGASKFVRGDAVAGILILFINIIGGLLVGTLQHDMAVADAASNYTLLTIGDGLVAQIPALLVSTAAGVVVTRVATDEDTSQQIMSQVLNKPQVLAITAAIIGMMGLVPGMPHIAFLLFAAALGGAAWWLRQQMLLAREEAAPAPKPLPSEAHEATWNDVAPVDTLGLEVGYRLIALVDRAQDGELLRRIKAIRKKFAQEVGFLAPPVHIRDNLELKPNAYRISLKGVEVGRGEAYTGMYLAINPSGTAIKLAGIVTRDPAFGLPAVWLDAANRDQAQNLGLTVVDAGTVIATHLNHLMMKHAAELLGRVETQQLLDHLARENPKLLEDLVPKTLPLAVVQKVLQSLLDESVHIRDMRTIIEVLAENAPRTQDPSELVALVRAALGRAIVQSIVPGEEEVPVIALDPELERLLLHAMDAGSPERASIEPGLAETLMREAAAATQKQEQMGLSPVLIVPGPLRPLLARFLRRTLPQLRVIAQAEVPDARTLRVTAIIGGRG